MEIKQDYSLKHLNTFGIDAKAKAFAVFHSTDELRKLLADSTLRHLPLLVLGGGSNILFTGDYPGLVLLNKIHGIEIVKDTGKDAFVKAGAGEVWHEVVSFATQHNLGGIENLSLIPGTIGAAPIQNIGAYGVELKDSFDSLEAIETSTGKIRSFTGQECAFGYRDSIFKRDLKGKYIITSVTLRLSKTPVFNTSYGAIQQTLDEMGVKELSLKAISNAVIHIRRSKLPDPALIGNAGSFFKNPEVDENHFKALQAKYPDIPSFPTLPGKVKIPAGWLNEKCGWKGKTIGQAGVHKQQALVLVNYGQATGQEIRKLAQDIQTSVRDTFGIELEMEVNII